VTQRVSKEAARGLLHSDGITAVASCLMYASKWASANFVDSLCSFGCVLLLNQIFKNNVPFDNIPLQFI